MAAGIGGGILGTVREHNGGTNENASIFMGEHDAMYVLIKTMSEGDAE